VEGVGGEADLERGARPTELGSKRVSSGEAGGERERGVEKTEQGDKGREENDEWVPHVGS
jgi:hypothetical protein